MDLSMKEFLNDIKENTNISSVGRFEHVISSKDSKININVVALDDEKAVVFKEQMKNLYSSKILEDESFSYRYSMEDFDVLLNNILDWIDPDIDSRNGGDETRYYQRKTPSYKPRNAPIPTLSELNMIEGMNDEVFELISPMVTVFSGTGINVNKIDKTMWKTIDNRLSDEEIELIMERLSLSGFADEKELRTWIGENTRIPATEFNPLKISLAFDDENFKIEATGYSGRVSKKMISYVSSNYKSLLSGGTQVEQDTTSGSLKPDVVYWEIK
jgi:type II secretory pathway component PulK